MPDQRAGNGSKLPPLTATQIDALKRLNDIEITPHGVYRSLVIRGYLRPVKMGYQLTPEGRAYIAAKVITES
jgi:hypothetical protein